MKQHKLSSIDEINLEATCTIDGRVKIRRFPAVKADYRYECLASKGNGGRIPPNQPCAICGKETRLVWDHEHETGEFRGWICHPCNSMLGFSYDNVNTLARAIEYLTK